MKTIENCLGHLKGGCPHCTPDEDNKKCPNYRPYIVRTFEVVKDSNSEYTKH